MSDTLRRITVDEVRAAVEKTGLRPEPGIWLNGNGDKPTCGCALGILAHSQGISLDRPNASIPEAAGLMGLDQEYTEGFISGFDGEKCACPDEPNHALGFTDGLAIRQALLPEAVTA